MLFSENKSFTIENLCCKFRIKIIQLLILMENHSKNFDMAFFFAIYNTTKNFFTTKLGLKNPPIFFQLLQLNLNRKNWEKDKNSWGSIYL